MTKLAGHNLLIIEPNAPRAANICQFLTNNGANVFVATDIVQAQALQQKWDIDIVLGHEKFLEEVSDPVVRELRPDPFKNPPLLFVYGEKRAVSPQRMSARGVLLYFSLPLDLSLIVKEIGHFLYDPWKHIKQLGQSELEKQIRLLLQKGETIEELQVPEFLEDGMTLGADVALALDGALTLSICLPNSKTLRFAVSAQAPRGGEDGPRLKVQARDLDRWRWFLDHLKRQQSSIDNFLKASSGK